MPADPAIWCSGIFRSLVLCIAGGARPAALLGILTLASAGWGGGVMQHPRVFLKWPPNRWTDRAENLHS